VQHLVLDPMSFPLQKPSDQYPPHADDPRQRPSCLPGVVERRFSRQRLRCCCRRRLVRDGPSLQLCAPACVEPPAAASPFLPWHPIPDRPVSLSVPQPCHPYPHRDLVVSSLCRLVAMSLKPPHYFLRLPDWPSQATVLSPSVRPTALPSAADRLFLASHLITLIFDLETISYLSFWMFRIRALAKQPCHTPPHGSPSRRITPGG
jgi:hypothetical protein